MDCSVLGRGDWQVQVSSRQSWLLFFAAGRMYRHRPCCRFRYRTVIDFLVETNEKLATVWVNFHFLFPLLITYSFFSFLFIPFWFFNCVGCITYSLCIFFTTVWFVSVVCIHVYIMLRFPKARILSDILRPSRVVSQIISILHFFHFLPL